jgi:arabinose-5-phosphate isomerase
LEDIISITALRTLDIEAETIAALRQSIDADFRMVAEQIFHSTGRVVVTGVGKSAIIAQKIVATFNSTGTPSLFMHAADAIHGDLGMIRPDDIVICISKSGDTAEIKVLVPLLRNLGNLLIGMVSNRQSYLGHHAKYILYTPVSQEAEPNNLAPTASTTAQMALGDALASALLALRGFTPQDFAQYHPGGSLGKRLYLRVSDLYPNNERPVVHQHDDLRSSLLEMTSKRLGATAVLDASERLVGVITDGDLRRMLEKGLPFESLLADDVMTRHPKTIVPEALAAEAFEHMRQHSITQLLVVDDSGAYLGIVHLHDLIREGLI